MSCSTPGFPVLHHLLESAQTHVVHWVSDAIQPSHSLSSPSPPALNPSQHQGLFQWVSSSAMSQLFCSESAPHVRWPKHWSFSFSISPSNEYSGLISLRIDWFDLLAVKGLSESFPAPQIKSINFSALSLLYGPTLTSIHDYWKNHNFDHMNLYQ